MTGHGVDDDLNNSLRKVVLALEFAPNADSDQAERSARQLHAELKNLDVGSVGFAAPEHAPLGAKGDPFSWGTLIITLAATGGVFPIFLATAKDWLARSARARRISVTIDGDTIVLEKGSSQERNSLIEAYIRRHEVT